MSWTPARFAKDADDHYCYAQGYDPSSRPDVNADLQEALRAVASAQDAAREVIKALAQHPGGLAPDQFTYAEGYLASIEASTRKLREGFEFLSRSQ